VDNCYAYNNTRNPHLPPMADALYRIAETAFEELEPEITELEKVLNPEEQYDLVDSATKETIEPILNQPIQSPMDQFTGEEEVDVVF